MKEILRKNVVILIIAGLFLGIAGTLIGFSGGASDNMGFCSACMISGNTNNSPDDIKSDLFKPNPTIADVARPEIMSLVFGAFVFAIITKNMKYQSGSSPIIRFILGAVMFTGSQIFIGCTFRMVLRLGSGDLNALVGLGGFLVGAVIASLFIKKGFFSLGRKYTHDNQAVGFLFPILFTIPLLYGLVINRGNINFLTTIIIMLFGVAMLYSRFCQTGAIRNIVLIKDYSLLYGMIAFFVGSLVVNLAKGSFDVGFTTQTMIHNEHLWNFLGLFIVGFAGVLLDGCPMRQLVMSATGDGDAALTVMGMFFAAETNKILDVASSPVGLHGIGKMGYVTQNGKVATIVCLVLLFVIAIAHSKNITEKVKGWRKTTSQLPTT